jgi:TolA-binding protein
LTTEFPASALAADALYRLGHLIQKRGELRQAAEVFGQLAANYPKHELAPQALFAEASCFGRAKQNEDAVAAWARLIEKYPGSKFVEESLYQKGMVEVALRRDEQARSTLGELLKTFPGTRFLADAQFWLGVLLEEKGKLDDAERAFRKALESKPSPELMMKGQFRLGLVMQRQGKIDEAAKIFQALLETSFKMQFTPELLEWMAEYYLGRNQFVLADETADTLMARTATDTWKQIAWSIKGKAELGQGRQVMARQAFEKAVGIDIKGAAAAEARLKLGDLCLAAGEMAEAKAEYERAAGMAVADTLLSVRVHAYAGIAKALKAQGNLDGAARHFLSVAVLFDDPVLVPECLDEAAEAFAKAGRKDESDKVVKELLERYPDSVWAKKRQKSQ